MYKSLSFPGLFCYEIIDARTGTQPHTIISRTHAIQTLIIIFALGRHLRLCYIYFKLHMKEFIL